MHALGHKYSDLAGYRVYIDAGHGQNDSNNGLWDPGAIGNGWREADLTADLARRVGNILTNKYGIACYVNDKGGYYKLRQADAEARDCTSLVSHSLQLGRWNWVRVAPPFIIMLLRVRSICSALFTPV